MGKGATNIKLRAWRTSRGLRMEDAAALVIVDGEPCGKATWHGWESAGKVPKERWMIPLCKLTGLEPNDFYPRIVDGAPPRSEPEGGNGAKTVKPPRNDNGGSPPQMALAI